ncbi:uncharacterized protein JN550_010229 [Neoarthrinium moseri]|uniref:uncharacterized protein n=1 Tax=Neoarthrinium moseri TaxID=1658444 RepID=UPI001FDDC732|nr:uncharacterized protein JN550_010229 [Neoarthrinium moseri]KAI1862367.1 hypothetical protein JN550_010229 [Neoarthrinium moseri]
MSSDMKASLHRFRVTSRASPSPQNSSSSMPQPDWPPSAGGVENSQNPAAAKPSHIPACDRCRNFKKKCSRTFPVCSLCASAGTKCSFSTPASSTTAQTHHLRARIEWLSGYLNQALPLGAPTIDTIETGTDLTELIQWISSNAVLSQGHSPASARSGPQNVVLQDDQPMLDHRALDAVHATSSPAHQPLMAHSSEPYDDGSRIMSDRSNVVGQGLPANAAARRFVDAYFRNVNRAYPFVDRNKVLRDMETLGDCAKRQRDPDSTLLYLIMAIGCTTLQRAGQIPSDTTLKFEVAYADIIQECLCREGVESIQILVLLALYSLFDPLGPSAWSIVGIVARQAMLLGLTRRSSDEKSLPPISIELQHRLLWSIYVLDRMLATSLGLPSALADENMDVPLPGLTVDEFASPDRSQFASILQTSRHVIMLRQMESRIMDQIHLLKHSKISSLTHADRRSILQDMRADIENWYSNGCLVSPLEPDNVPIHNSITWLSARYYYLLILLYYPSHFNSFGCGVSIPELLRFAQKHIQSSSVLFQQRQLPLNRVTLCRMFPVGLVFMHCCVTGAQDCTSFTARDEVTMMVNILEAFSEGWANAHRAAQILRQFLSVIGSLPNYAPLQFQNGAYVSGQIAGSRESTRNVLRPIVTSFVALMQEVLGKTTCFGFLEAPEETDIGVGMNTTLPSPNGTGRGSVASVPGIVGGDGSEMNYSWSGPLELDFL